MRAGWALRPAGGWSVLLARLSSMGDHAVAVRRTALALVGLVTVVFGWWGFARYSGQHPDVGLGWPEWLYGTMNLFINGADVAPVPWQLGVARMLAPLVTFGVLVEVLLVGSAQRIRRWAASRASGHVLVVGPTERVRPYLQGSADDRGLGDGTELIVHIGQDGSALGPTVIGLHGDAHPDRVGCRHPGTGRTPDRVGPRPGRPDVVGAAGSARPWSPRGGLQPGG